MLVLTDNFRGKPLISQGVPGLCLKVSIYVMQFLAAAAATGASPVHSLRCVQSNSIKVLATKFPRFPFFARIQLAANKRKKQWRLLLKATNFYRASQRHRAGTGPKFMSLG